MSKGQTRVIDDGDLRKYRTEIPNLLDDSDLDPFEFRLYAHLKRVAGDSGYCKQGARKIALHCNISVGKVVAAKHSLQEKGFIQITPGNSETSTPDTITITSLWEQNFKAYAPVHTTNTPRSPHEHPVHETPLPRSGNEHPVHHMNERSNKETKELNQEKTKEVSSRAPARSPTEKKISEMSDSEFIGYLESEPAYSHIDIKREAGKMRKWCESRNKQPTRRRFVTWLNNIDPPLNGDSNGKSSGNSRQESANMQQQRRNYERFRARPAPGEAVHDSNGVQGSEPIRPPERR